MPEVTAIDPLLAPWIALGVLLGGAAVVWVLHAIWAAVLSGTPLGRGLLELPARFALLVLQRPSTTERPDAMLRVLAPAVYAAMAAAALSVIPLSEGVSIADVRTGIVVFGAAEALAIVAIFMHGWSPNAHLSLLGAYRFVALGLSYELVSMFVLIAAALPAQSLQVSAIVSSQAELWNVIRQPLGLPLWLVPMTGVAFWGPLNLADGADLVGGTSAEVSGPPRLLWQAARGAMLAVMAAMGAAAFLGGPLGPVLPGWGWMAIKTFAVLLVVTGLGHLFGRVSAQKTMGLLWTIALPLSFVHLGLAGWEALP